MTGVPGRGTTKSSGWSAGLARVTVAFSNIIDNEGDIESSIHSHSLAELITRTNPINSSDVPTCDVLASRALGRRTVRDRPLEPSATMNCNLRTPLIVSICRCGQINPMKYAERNQPPKPTSESKPALIPRAIWGGTPGESGCLADLRDFLNFLEDDILIKKVKKRSV